MSTVLGSSDGGKNLVKWTDELVWEFLPLHYCVTSERRERNRPAILTTKGLAGVALQGAFEESITCRMKNASESLKPRADVTRIANRSQYPHKKALRAPKYFKNVEKLDVRYISKPFSFQGFSAPELEFRGSTHSFPSFGANKSDSSPCGGTTA